MLTQKLIFISSVLFAFNVAAVESNCCAAKQESVQSVNTFNALNMVRNKRFANESERVLVDTPLPAYYGLPQKNKAQAFAASSLPIVSGRRGILGSWNGVLTFYPYDLSSGVTAWTYRDGTWKSTFLPGGADGMYSGPMDLLPDELYYVELKSWRGNWIATRDTFVDWATPQARRPNLVANVGRPTLTTPLTNLASLQVNDELLAYVPSHHYFNWASPGLSTGTTWTWTIGNQYPYWEYRLETPSDTVYFFQQKLKVANAKQYLSMVRMRALSINLQDSQTKTQSLNMVEFGAQLETVRANADFVALKNRLEAPYTKLMGPIMSVNVGIAGSEKGLTPEGMLAFAVGQAAWYDDIGDFQIGKLPTEWIRSYSLEARYQRNLMAPGATKAKIFEAESYRHQATAPSISKKLVMTLQPPANPRIGDTHSLSLLDPQSGVGLTPLLSWSIPQGVTANGSEIAISEIFNVSGETRAQWVANLSSEEATQIRIPPGLLVAGKSYVISFGLMKGNNTNFPFREPFSSGTVFEYAEHISGVIRP